MSAPTEPIFSAGAGQDIAPRPFTVTHRSVLTLAIPMMLTHLSTPLVGLVSTGVIGQLGDAALVGGVALAAVIFDVIFVSCNFLRGATTGFTAQAVGAGDRTEEQTMLAGGILIAVAIGLALLLLHAPLGQLGLSALNARGEVADAAQAYYDIRVWSAPFVLFNYVIFGWILGRGEAVIALLLQTLLNGLGIGLAIWLVLHANQGVEGAAWATLIAEAVTALVGIGLVYMRSDKRHWRPDLLTDLSRIRRLFSVNADMLVRSVALLAGISFFTRESGQFGTDILAANTILLRYYFFAVSFLDGVAAAAEQLAGRSIGARYRPAFDQTIRLTTLWGVIFAIIMALAFFATGPAVISLMAPTEIVQQAAHTYLPWAAILPLTGVLAFQMDGVYIGATWSREMRNMMLASLVTYVVAEAMLTPWLGNHGLWLSMHIFQGARSIFFRLWMPRLASRTFAMAPAVKE